MENKLKTDLTKAIILATKEHKFQEDKGGNPYILHPLSVMNKVDTLEEKIVAVLHDILEDTAVTEDFLREICLFDEKIIEAIVCLTKKENEEYMGYINRILKNKLATTVKMADLQDNMNLSRLGALVDEKAYERKEKYQKAYDYLWEKTF